MKVIMCFFCILANIPSMILLYIPFSNNISNKQKKKLFIAYTALLVINFIIYLTFELTIGTDILFYRFNLLSFSIFIVIVNSIVVSNMAFENLFVFGLVENITLVLESFSLYIQQFLQIQDFYIQIILDNVIIILLFLILFIPIKKIIINIIFPFFIYKRKNYWKNIWILTITIFLPITLISFSSEYVSNLIELLGRLSIAVATLVIYRSISYDYSEILKMEKISEQLQMQKHYYKALAENVEKVRKARHDLKYHMSTISWFVEREDYDALSNYLEEFKTTYKIDSGIPYTGNSAADGIIYHYMECAKENGIRFEVNCSFNNLNIHDVDLCTLLGNVLENALTASKNAKDDKFIAIYSENDNNQLTLIVDNSYDGVIIRKNGKIISKKNTEDSGIGIISMKAICKKYNGYCTFEANEKVFHSSFILNNGTNN